MFIKPYFKFNKTLGERYTVYKLCESYRLGGGIHHRIIINFGRLDEFETVEQMKLLEIGAEWLCKQAFDQLGIGSFLRQQGWEEDKIALATTHIISRAVYPASELKTVSFIKENSVISEITGLDKNKITKDLLYNIAHKLYTNNMSDYGFGQKEIIDFIEYWIPKFTNSKYLLIYPQEKQIIDKAIVLNVSKNPDNILRLFYAIKETNDYINNLTPPFIEPFKKVGFYITEWGIVY